MKFDLCNVITHITEIYLEGYTPYVDKNSNKTSFCHNLKIKFFFNNSKIFIQERNRYKQSFQAHPIM